MAIMRAAMVKKALTVAAVLACSVAWADLARVSVTWTRPDLYVTAEGAYIRTAGCTEFTIGEDAVLRYLEEPNDALTFRDGVTCRVVEVFK